MLLFMDMAKSEHHACNHQRVSNLDAIDTRAKGPCLCALAFPS